MKYGDWRDEHLSVIKDFLSFLNRNGGGMFVLKGGTALMLCYGLTRFSEDVDLDGVTGYDIFSIVDSFSQLKGYSYRKAKDTQTVKRAMIHYGGYKPLKVEVSYRKSVISSGSYSVVNGILVYNILSMLDEKLRAYLGRTALRDLYDIVFISLKYWCMLSDREKDAIRNSFYQKDLSYIDYLLKTQEDVLINKSDLEFSVLRLFSLLGLM